MACGRTNVIRVACGGLFLVALGCSAWEGLLDPQYERSVSAKLRDINRTNFASRMSKPPASVDEKIDGINERLPKADMTVNAALDRKRQPAPQKMDMGVQEARLAALRNNLKLQASFIDPDIAKTFISEERAKFDATIVAGIDLSRKDLPELDDEFVTFTSSNDALDKQVVKLTRPEQTKETLDMDLGIKIPTPTGAIVEIGQAFPSQELLQPQNFPQYVSASKFSLSQPLLRNAGVPVNTASIRIARLNDKAIEAKTKLTAIRVLAKAEKTYWKAYAAAREFDIRREQYDLAFDNFELVQKLVEEGATARIEVARARLGTVKRREPLIEAETKWRLAQRELKLILNMENVGLDSPTVIVVETEPHLAHYEFKQAEREALVAEALENRMEMLELELKLAADAIKIDFARNQTLPLFMLDFEYGVLDRQGSFGSSFRGAWDFDNTTYKLGLRGEIPVTNEKRLSKLRRAVATRTQRLATRQLREMMISQEVFDTLDVMEQNWQRILVARQNVIVAGINYEIELTQFREGLRTMREVLEALTSLGEAQLKEVKAIVAYQESQIDLAFATGTLLGYSDVDVDPVPLY